MPTCFTLLGAAGNTAQPNVVAKGKEPNQKDRWKVTAWSTFDSKHACLANIFSDFMERTWCIFQKQSFQCDLPKVDWECGVCVRLNFQCFDFTTDLKWIRAPTPAIYMERNLLQKHSWGSSCMMDVYI